MSLKEVIIILVAILIANLTYNFLIFRKLQVVYVKILYILFNYFIIATALKIITGDFLPVMFDKNSILVIDVFTIALNVWFIMSVVFDKNFVCEDCKRIQLKRHHHK